MTDFLEVRELKWVLIFSLSSTCVHLWRLWHSIRTFSQLWPYLLTSSSKAIESVRSKFLFLFFFSFVVSLSCGCSSIIVIWSDDMISCFAILVSWFLCFFVSLFLCFLVSFFLSSSICFFFWRKERLLISCWK